MNVIIRSIVAKVAISAIPNGGVFSNLADSQDPEDYFVVTAGIIPANPEATPPTEAARRVVRIFDGIEAARYQTDEVYYFADAVLDPRPA